MSRLTLLDKHRLRNASDYSLCYEKGRKYYSPCFILFVYKQDEQNEPWRLGMAVTKKIGSAVRRNRVRRLIREYFRLSQHYIPNGYDFVVVPKRGIDVSSLTLDNVSEEIYSFILSRIGKKNKKRSA